MRQWQCASTTGPWLWQLVSGGDAKIQNAASCIPRKNSAKKNVKKQNKNKCQKKTNKQTKNFCSCFHSGCRQDDLLRFHSSDETSCWGLHHSFTSDQKKKSKKKIMTREKKEKPLGFLFLIPVTRETKHKKNFSLMCLWHLKLSYVCARVCVNQDTVYTHVQLGK